MKCCMLQVRGGVERDRNGRKAGKGALLTYGHAPTLGVVQDATLIQVGEEMEESTAMSYDGYNQSAHNESCYPLPTMNGSEGDDRTPKVAASFGINPQGGQMLPFDHEVGETLAIGHQGGVMQAQTTTNVADTIASMRYIVRRLTPTECCRLMGLPDGYTMPCDLVITDELVKEFVEIHNNFNRIMAEYEGTKPPKPKTEAQVRKWLEKISDPTTCPDAPRYKACGNGWATNQPRWILLRLLVSEGIDPWKEN